MQRERDREKTHLASYLFAVGLSMLFENFQAIQEEAPPASSKPTSSKDLKEVPVHEEHVAISLSLYIYIYIYLSLYLCLSLSLYVYTYNKVIQGQCPNGRMSAMVERSF